MNRRPLIVAIAVLALAPGPSRAQAVARMALGGTLGVAGGAAATLGIITARARFQNEYLHNAEDLIHWQAAPMILGPAVGVTFGLAGPNALEGSVVGSLGGFAGGAALGAGIGWLASSDREAPWAGALIGGGLGITIGGIAGGMIGWGRDNDNEEQTPSTPVSVTLVRIPL